MFDIGFFELIIIAMVGLFVIGPERLPETIKTVALWVGRIKRNILETRTEIEQQLGADEIRRQLQNEQVLHNLEKMKDTRKELEDKIRQWQQGEPLEQVLDGSKTAADNKDAQLEAPEPTASGQAPAADQSEPAHSTGTNQPSTEAPRADAEQPPSPDHSKNPGEPQHQDTKKNNGL